RPHRDLRARGRSDPADARARDRLREHPHLLRPPDRGQPGHLLPGRRPRRHGRDLPTADVQGGVAQGRGRPWAPDHQGGRQGRLDRQALHLRGRGERDPDRDPGLRRQRLHGGVPGRPLLPRCQDPRDRRGHLRGPAHGHRPPSRAAGLSEGRVMPSHPLDPRVEDVRRRIREARDASERPSAKAAAKLESQHKLYVRDRIALLVDEGSFVEDGRYANALAEGLPADGVVTGRGLVDERPVVIIANDPTVKAGSWGARTVEKIVRATEIALREELPVLWLVDSAGARITDQVEMFPGRRGAGHIFHNQVALSGKVPQVCCLFGPSAAGGAYIPSFTDLVIMVDGNASMYLGRPRMAEMVVGEKVSLEEMGGARMHCTVSGVGDVLVEDDSEAIEVARLWLSYLP